MNSINSQKQKGSLFLVHNVDYVFTLLLVKSYLILYSSFLTEMIK